MFIIVFAEHLELFIGYYYQGNNSNTIFNYVCFSGKVAITLDAFWADPKDPNSPADVQAAEDYLQMHVSYLGVVVILNSPMTSGV